MGDANASIPTPEPVIMRPMFGAIGMAAAKNSILFVSKRCYNEKIAHHLLLNKHIVPIDNTRNIGKKDMKLNDTTPAITVHPETYRVEADGVHLTCAPAVSVPLAQRYFIV